MIFLSRPPWYWLSLTCEYAFWKIKIPKLQSLSQFPLLVHAHIPCVPGIVAFINKDIELRIFFYLLLLCLNHFSLEFTKNLRPKRMPARILTIDIYDSHTQADKIDHLLYKKNYYINYNLLQLTRYDFKKVLKFKVWALKRGPP